MNRQQTRTPEQRIEARNRIAIQSRIQAYLREHPGCMAERAYNIVTAQMDAE